MATEVLKQLFESELLTQETKQSIAEAFNVVLEEAKATARVEVEAELTAKYAEEYARDRDALIETLDTVVSNKVQEHIDLNVGELEKFRDLEVEAASALLEAQNALVDQSKRDLRALVEKIDQFLDVAVQAEFDEMKEDLVESQRLALGAKIFEGFRSEFERLYVQETGVAGQVTKLSRKLKTTERTAAELKESLQRTTRELELSKLLSTLEGKPRQVMETILTSVSTEKLSETYDRFIGRVISENTTSVVKRGNSSEKEMRVLAESKVDPMSDVKFRSGDEPETKKGVRVKESVGLSEEDKRQLLKSAGLI